MTEHQKKKLAVKIKEIRDLTGKTQAEISKEFYISRTCWSYYESSKRLPSLETVCNIAARFNLSLDSLLGSKELPADAKDLMKREKEISSSLTKDGNLDMSNLTLADKISLVDYKKFLLWKHRESEQ